jgi:Outer membrane protein (OmpH-like).
MKNCAKVCFVAVVASLLIAGCSSQQAKTTPPAQPSPIGIIDMDRAVKAHPRYADVQRLQQEYAATAARLDAERAQGHPAWGPAESGSASGLEQAAAKEFDARMAAKDTMLRTKLEAAAEQIHRDIASELDAYTRELDKEYQPQIFSLQLKLNTVQLSKEDAAAVQAELGELKRARAAKIAARQQELAIKADAAVKDKQRGGQEELDAYARSLQTEMAARDTGGQAAGGRTADPGQAVAPAGADELAAVARNIGALQELIINDIRDKAAKVAIQHGLSTVLAGVKVNVSATDITDEVIAEFKK